MAQLISGLVKQVANDRAARGAGCPAFLSCKPRAKRGGKIGKIEPAAKNPGFFERNAGFGIAAEAAARDTPHRW